MENRDTDEIALKAYVVKTKSYFSYIFSNWKFIAAMGFVCAGMGLLLSFIVKPKYEGKTTFVLSSSKENSGLMGLASQFGFDFGGSGNDAFSGDNIKSLFKSQLLLKRAIFNKDTVENKLLINRLMELYKLDKAYVKKERTKSVYPFPADYNKLTPTQDSVFKELHELVNEKLLSVDKPDTKTSIYEVKTVSKDELFSFFLTKYLVDETTKFYIETKTRIARQNLDMLQGEADSLRTLLGGTITHTAAATDRIFNSNPAYQVNRSPALQGQARVTVLGTAYGEVIKNLELAKITLQKETPLMQIIDEPVLPLKKIRIRKLKGIVIGGILGGLLAIFYLTGGRMYRNIMQES